MYPETNTNTDRAKAAAERAAKVRMTVLGMSHRQKTAQHRANQLREQKEGTTKAAKAIETMSELKHIPNFFPTPHRIVNMMLEMTGMAPHQRGADPTPLRVLEPSAGKGDIAHAVLRAGHLCQCVEYNYTLAELLRKEGCVVRQADFLALSLADFQFASLNGGFDRIIMNPPFERGACYDHVKHALGFLRSGGYLAAVVSATTLSKIEEVFEYNESRYLPIDEAPSRNAIPTWIYRDYMAWQGFDRIEFGPLADDTFKNSERPTSVRTGLVVLRKN